MAKHVLKLESWLERPLGRTFGFRLLTVFEKRATS
jgi:hypothetical protein